MPNIENRRADKRTSLNTAVDLQIVFASEAPGLLGKRISGTTADISPGGIGINLGCEIPVDCTLDFRITLKHNAQKYFLSGKVRWCQPAKEDGQYAIGISMHERTDTDTDLDSWKQQFNN